MDVAAERAVWSALLAVGLACQAPPDEGIGEEAPTDRPFADATAAAGLDFVHFNGMSGELYVPEMMGPGGALVDVDEDGDLDLYLVQGTMLRERTKPEEARFPPRHPLPLTDRLYRNGLESTAGVARRLRFTDVTAESRLGPAAYGMGVAAGDVDNDGRVDLYVTAFGPNRLLHNQGDATFAERAETAGVGERRWSVAALFFDYDRDGWLDLYVGNYLDVTLGTHKACLDPTGARDYCGPQAYRGVPDRLFRNRGDGTFEDVSLGSRIGLERGKGLGAVAADLDRDGWLDLYVANDGEPNRLWRNRGDGTFEDLALFAGCAVDGEGRPEASMGVDAGDLDNDGDLDLIVTHLSGETNALYRNRGDGLFDDWRWRSGAGPPSFEPTGFGAAWLDYDLDGWLDLVVANGAVRHLEAQVRAGDPYPLHQTKQLFHNRGDGTLEEMTPLAGPAFARSAVGRGIAVGDVDNDGDPDLLVVDNNGPARLLLNRQDERQPASSWVGLRLVGTGGGRDMLGALVVVEAAGFPPLLRRVASDGSYASASDPRVQIGLGLRTEPVQVRARWPSSRSELWRDLEPGRYHTLHEGSGEPAEWR